MGGWGDGEMGDMLMGAPSPPPISYLFFALPEGSFREFFVYSFGMRIP